jgi:hypothetical protein
VEGLELMGLWTEGESQKVRFGALAVCFGGVEEPAWARAAAVRAEGAADGGGAV